MADEKRLPIKSLVLAVATVIGVAGYEGYSQVATQPLPGDVPTYGYGTTRHADGSPVRLGEVTTREQAAVDLRRDVLLTDTALNRCMDGINLFAHEKRAYTLLGYNVGAAAVCQSSIPVKLRAGQFEQACAVIIQFDKFRDRTKPKVRNPRTGKMEYPLVRIKGLTNRRQSEYKICMGRE